MTNGANLCLTCPSYSVCFASDMLHAVLITVLFIYKCFFHSSSLVKFIFRYGIMFSQFRSNLGSNFYFCLLQCKFYKQSFFDGCINIRNIIYQHRAGEDKELNSYWVAKFMKDCIMSRDEVKLGHPFCCLKKNCVV